MSLIKEFDDDTMLEECLEEVEELIMSLDRYSPTTIAAAMSTHLEGLLRALLDARQCTADEVRDLLQEIESGIIEGPAA